MPTASRTLSQANNKTGDKPTARQVLDKLKLEKETCSQVEVNPNYENEFNQVSFLKQENDRLSYIIKEQEAELLNLYRKVYSFR